MIFPFQFMFASGSITIDDIRKWKVADVLKWAKEEMLAKVVVDAFQEHAIIGSVLVEGISDQDLQDMNISSKIVRRTTLGIISRLLEQGFRDRCLY